MFIRWIRIRLHAMKKRLRIYFAFYYYIETILFLVATYFIIEKELSFSKGGDCMDFLIQNLVSILITALTALLSYVGLQLKKLYEAKVKEDGKRHIVETVVAAVEQIYPDLSGNEKLLKAEENIKTMFKEKKISVSDFEIKMLIEQNCHLLKKKGESL